MTVERTTARAARLHEGLLKELESRVTADSYTIPGGCAGQVGRSRRQLPKEKCREGASAGVAHDGTHSRSMVSEEARHP